MSIRRLKARFALFKVACLPDTIFSHCYTRISPSYRGFVWEKAIVLRSRLDKRMQKMSLSPRAGFSLPSNF